ncbi:MAG: LacI family DNA-binding transcriptional regulator [Lachnospiraceae bacterium]|nr:LacI family DNA-binding transcriptional regulator [Lachnospiraceae bacterium]
MIRKNVTMGDIAKELGVSTVSVSKALTGKEGVSEAVRELIVKKAEEMGYRYTGSKGVKEKEKHTIGILISEHFITKDAYYSRLYERTMMMLSEQKQMGMLEIIMRQVEKDLEAPALLASDRIEGIIVLGQMSKQYLNMLREFDKPILYMDFYDQDILEDAVISDSVFGSGILTNYLIHKGHKRIAFVGSIRSTSSIMDRYIGYYRAMLAAGLETKKEWLIEDRDDEGDKIELVLPKDMPTAFVCNSDAIAFDLVKKLQKEGYRVPEDISVVGFDNFIYSEMSSPKITTYGVDTDALVRNSIRIILEKLENPDYSVGRVLVAGTLIERHSVQPIND